jgi:hypothetical protein
VPSRTTTAAAKEEEGVSKPVGIVRKTVVVPEARVKMMLADPRTRCSLRSPRIYYGRIPDSGSRFWP